MYWSTGRWYTQYCSTIREGRMQHRLRAGSKDTSRSSEAAAAEPAVPAPPVSVAASRFLQRVCPMESKLISWQHSSLRPERLSEEISIKIQQPPNVGTLLASLAFREYLGSSLHPTAVWVTG